ncbi:MAG: carboxypeptidase regulatory-like domain-containing protein [Acidobacteria bacterium]|nr:carboxypeptidase regulatory-like domain-containing protein [Acidobacteriota bacterium]
MFSKRAKFWLTFLILLSLSLVTLGACKGGDEEADEGGEDGDEAQAGVPYKAPANLGSITGTIALTGQPPAAAPIDMSADTNCASKSQGAVVETVAVKDGKLQNVFVYVKEGSLATGGNRISGFTFPTPGSAVTLDQVGCRYSPHIVGVQVNQKLSVVNSDPTAHNINVQPSKGNPSWNISQSPGTAPIEKSFTRPETLIPVKCNQHPWMKAYVGVLKHPFFAVSAADGTFTIKDVPPGKYTIVAWHEKFGEQTIEVTVPDNGAGTANFSFDGSKVAELTGGSLEIMPALEFPMMGAHH